MQIAFLFWWAASITIRAKASSHKSSITFWCRTPKVLEPVGLGLGLGLGLGADKIHNSLLSCLAQNGCGSLVRGLAFKTSPALAILHRKLLPARHFPTDITLL